MSNTIAPSSAVHLASANAILKSQSVLRSQMLIADVIRRPRRLPFADTQQGSLFQDKDDANATWYLPGFSLVQDPDPLFAFAASRSGIDAQGNPFNRATLTFGVAKIVPPEVEAARVARPERVFNEISLRDLAVTLTVVAKDPSDGSDRPIWFPCQVTQQNDAAWHVTIENVLGVNVILLYENLIRSGAAMLTVSAAYDVWRTRSVGRPPIVWSIEPRPFKIAQADIALQPVTLVPSPPPILRVPSKRAIATTDREMLAVEPRLAASHLQQANVRAVAAQPVLADKTMVRADKTLVRADMRMVRHPGLDNEIPRERIDVRRPVLAPGPGPRPERPVHEVATHHFSIAAPLNLKYAADAYRLKLTIADGGDPRPIIDINDLRGFDKVQSEFIALTALGNVGARYPSIRELYLGVLSRTIAVIPQRYVIVRDGAGCAAVCRALVDSTAGAGSGCKFQFEFLLAPDISPVEYLQLGQEVAASPDLAGCTLMLPELIAETQPAIVNSPFLTSYRFSNGPTPSTIVLSAEVREEAGGSQSVANANLFIRQLRAAREPFLSGAFDVKLDEGHPTVDTTALLSFRNTVGTGALGFQVDEAAQTIGLINAAPFPLRVSRYALGLAGGVHIQDLVQEIPAGGSLPVPLPPGHDGMGVLVDYEIALGDSIGKDQVGQFLEFQTQDVQNTRYVLGVNAGGVDFEGRAIDEVKARVSIAGPPQVSVPDLTLHKLRKLDSTSVMVPLQNALTRMNSTILLTIRFTDPQRPPVEFTKDCDFLDTPIMVLTDADLPA